MLHKSIKSWVVPVLLTTSIVIVQYANVVQYMYKCGQFTNKPTIEKKLIIKTSLRTQKNPLASTKFSKIFAFFCDIYSVLIRVA
jgi:hypothetical protein